MDGSTRNDANARLGLRCRPGNLARVIYSTNPALVRRIVQTTALHEDGRWECILIGDAVFGVADDGGSPLLTRDWLFPDSCLEPQSNRSLSWSGSLPESLLL